MKNKYENIQLKNDNLYKYLQDNYGEKTFTIKRILLAVPSLVQNDYGKKNDCTLTCIVACLSHRLNKFIYKDYYNIYRTVLKYAEKYGHNEKIGTNPLIINKIYSAAYKELNGNSIKIFTKYFKNIGVTPEKIISNIDNNKPMILSLMNDGRNYYTNHSVVIVGYSLIKYGENKENTLLILSVYDTWSKEVSFIDFKKLSIICSLNY